MMMITYRKFFVVAAAVAAVCLAPVSNAQGQQIKLGTVDMKKVFEGYYKKDGADAQIKERQTDAEKVYKGMVDDYQKANEEYRKLVESSNDQAVAADERDRRKKGAEAKLMDMQEIEKSLKMYQQNARSSIGDLERRMRDNLVKDIRDVVTAKAKAAGYTMILDTAGQSLYQTPLVLYSVAQSDLTDEVLKELNANAPATGAAKPDPKAAPADSVPPVLKEPARTSPTPIEKPAKKR